jgi:hypothetical protein
MDMIMALRRALAQASPAVRDTQGRPIEAAAWAHWPIEPLPDRGLAHLHLRLAGTGWLARIPKQSQMQLAAADNLRYQAECFRRAALSGHVPRLHAQLPAREPLPHGALLVEEVRGRAARLPADLGAIVRSLASLHALPLPAPEAAAPLLHAADPLRDLLADIETQIEQGGGHAGSDADRALQHELAQLRSLCAGSARPPRTLIAFDGHPGNFVVRDDGRAVLVDLEKCRYSYCGLDLAHATLYTSTTWDVQVQAVLSGEALRQAYAHWADAAGQTLAQAAQPWHGPLARAMWLWSLSWCAKWLALSRRAPRLDADGEDWSAAHSDAALVAHVRERVLHYLSAAGIACARRGIDEVQRACDGAIR